MTRSHRYPLLALAVALLASLACATVTRLAQRQPLLTPAPPPTATAEPGAAEDAGGQGPLEIEGGPTLGAPRETRIAISERKTRDLGGLTNESYTEEEVQQVGETFTYTAKLNQDEPLFWGYTWCATTLDILQANLEKMKIEVSVNGAPVALDQFYDVQFQNDQNLFCQAYVTVIYNWPAGKTGLGIKITYTELVNDGLGDYPEGTQMFEYEVTR